MPRKRKSSNTTFEPSQLRRARIGLALTQQEVAEQVGVKQPAISIWELGKATPTPEQLEALEDALGPLTESDDDDGGEREGASGPFGAWLKRAREAKRLSVRALARKAGVTPAAIYNLEAGRNANPQEAIRKALEAALGKVPDEVLEEAEREQKVEGLGALTDFDPHAASALPMCAGVYVLYDIARRPTYVGQGQVIKKRIVAHEQKFWFKRPVVETAAYITIDDAKLRVQIEQILIRFLKDHLLINKQGVQR
jgi:transcriptional regulator with XRE-family HTH domain